MQSVQSSQPIFPWETVKLTFRVRITRLFLCSARELPLVWANMSNSSSSSARQSVDTAEWQMAPYIFSSQHISKPQPSWSFLITEFYMTFHSKMSLFVIYGNSFFFHFHQRVVNPLSQLPHSSCNVQAQYTKLQMQDSSFKNVTHMNMVLRNNTYVMWNWAKFPHCGLVIAMNWPQCWLLVGW